MAALARISVACLLAAVPAAAFGTEVISDIVTSPLDEARALGIKSEQFWRPLLQATEGVQPGRHAALYADAEAVIAQLPAQNADVRQALAEALASLRRADTAVLAQAKRQASLASEQLAAPPGSGWGGSFSFLTGGQDFFAAAIRRFADGGWYSSRLREHVQERRAGLLPALRGAAAASGDVLKDCRAASARSFDALKHDLYQRGAARTPEAAKALARRLVEAASETRQRFLASVSAAADGIAKDAQGQGEGASATVTRAELQDMEPWPAAPAAKEELVISL